MTYQNVEVNPIETTFLSQRLDSDGFTQMKRYLRRGARGALLSFPLAAWRAVFTSQIRVLSQCRASCPKFGKMRGP